MGANPSPVSIFLAEDNPADVGLIRKALEEHSVEAVLIVVADGEKAIEFIQALDANPSIECPGLAIIDLNLPRKSGHEIVEQIRLSERCRLIPVLILSSSDAERDRAEALSFGANEYLRKPSRLDEFLRLGAIFKAALGTAPA